MRFISGYVNADGTIARGTDFTVDKQNAGQYNIDFQPDMKETPVVVATSDGGTRGTSVIVTYTNKSGCRIEGRAFQNNGLTDTGFGFMVTLPRSIEIAEAKAGR